MTRRLVATAVISGCLLSLGGIPPVASADSTRTITPQVDFFMESVKDKEKQKKVSKVMKTLRSRVHKTSYVSSGSSIYGWDCSGLVRWFYEQLGVGVPHSANVQAHIGKRVSKPQVGDIVVFARSGSTDFYHSGIYIGNRKVLNANRYYGTTVVEPLSDYKSSQIRFVRVDLNCWNNYETETQAIENCERSER